MFGDAALVSGHVRRGRLIVVTCSARSFYCRDMFDEVGIVSGRFRRGLVIVGRVRRVRLSVGRVLRDRISVWTCTTKIS